MKTILTLITCLLLSASGAQAKIWVVNNNPGEGGDFSDILDAITNATAGDTLYLVPSIYPYEQTGGAQKELHYVGGGYFLGENFNLAGLASPATTIRNSVSWIIGPGAEGSSYSSLRFETGTRNDLTVNCDSVKFSRCLFETAIVEGPSSSSYAQDIEFINCWFNGSVYYFEQSLFSNCYISNFTVQASGTTLLRDVVFDQCVIAADRINNSTGVQNNAVPFQACIVTNSIFTGSLYSTEADQILFDPDYFNSVSHCLFAIDQPTEGNLGLSNTFGVDMSTVFTDGGTSDTVYRLSASSPAKGAGTGGQDLGMFDGANPYVLSGVPPVPQLLRFLTPAVVTQSDGLNLDLIYKSRN